MGIYEESNYSTSFTGAISSAGKRKMENEPPDFDVTHRKQFIGCGNTVLVW